MPLDCFNSTEERDLFNAFHSNIAVSPEDKISFGRNWAFSGRQAHLCYNFNAGKHADKVGTVDTVMDVMQIVDALGGDRKVRFWGKLSSSLQVIPSARDEK